MPHSNRKSILHPIPGCHALVSLLMLQIILIDIKKFLMSILHTEKQKLHYHFSFVIVGREVLHLLHYIVQVRVLL